MPRIMGILNVTPDSFFDGGRYTTAQSILHQAEKIISEGADFIDVGGASSRPGAAEISTEEERRRVVEAISLVAKEFPGTIISVDTYRGEVARAAVEAGASMINDISGGTLDEGMFSTAARLKVPYVLMHMRGDPATMTRQTEYRNLLREVINYFHEKIYALQSLEIADVVVDPGFGFAKTREQNFVLLQNLDKLCILGKPVLAGLSRKSMVWKTLGIRPDEALNGTTALHALALVKGANILRVHDVKEASEVVRLFGNFESAVVPNTDIN